MSKETSTEALKPSALRHRGFLIHNKSASVDLFFTKQTKAKKKPSRFLQRVSLWLVHLPANQTRPLRR